MLDTYDLVYEQAVKNPSGPRRQELLAIQDTVSMLGAASPVACDPGKWARGCPGQAADAPGGRGGAHQQLLSFCVRPGQGWPPSVWSPERDGTLVVQKRLRIAGCSQHSIKQGPGDGRGHSP